MAISQEIGHKRGPADRRHAVRTVWSQQRTPGFSSLHLPPSLTLPPPFPPSSSPLRCRILRFMLAKGEVEPLCCGGNETESQPDRQPAKHAQRKTSGGKANAHTSTTAVENKFCSTHVYRCAGYTQHDNNPNNNKIHNHDNNPQPPPSPQFFDSTSINYFPQHTS